MDVCGKYSWEVFPVETDFEDVLISGEDIIKASSAVEVYLDTSAETSCTSTMVVSGSLDVSGTKLMAKITGGTEGQHYQIKFKAVTDAGNKYEHVVRLRVEKDRGA